MKAKNRKYHIPSLSQGKLHSSAVSVLVIVIAIAFVVLINILAGNIEKKYSLRADLSFNGITTQSDVTRAVLDSLDNDVHIYALFTQGNEDTALIALLERYSSASNYVSFSIEDITKNPLLTNILSDNLDDSAVSSDSVIIKCDATQRTRVLSGKDYLAYSYEAESGEYIITGLTYEKSITEALLYVTQSELPMLQILTGHGELSDTETSTLEQMLISANYQIKRLDLLSGEKPDPETTLMILSPLKDLTDSELAVLADFSAQGGCFFITSDYDDPVDLPNFTSLFRCYGFVSIPGIVVADSGEPGTYYSDSPAILIPEMLSTDATGILVTAQRDILILAGARAFEQQMLTEKNLILETVLQTGKKAFIRAYDDETMSLERQSNDRTGQFPLSLLADLAYPDGKHSRAFIIGNSSLFLEDWMQTYTYSTEFFLHTMKHLQNKAPISLDILSKQAVRPALSIGSAAPATIILLLLPIMVIMTSLFVLLPRKHL